MEYQALHNTPWMHGSFWVFVAVVIFAILAGRRIVGVLTSMLDARTQQVRDALDEAANLKAEAEAMLLEAQAAQAQAIKDAEQILASAQAEAARMAAALAAEAQATAKRRERMAMERIAAAEASAVNEVRAAAIDIATAASAQLLRDTFGAAADAAMIDQSITGVPAALRQAI
ncbi:F0F1 ATP synthase subunit B [Acidocella sp.]|jgi:F-type H+-transporting ATPase subunit b|uniref:F0F1 ATP synthase subunit B family protein n=1 Tax=Acidocella sp. TaxID=50710 RepID=UPI002F3F6A38